MSQYTLKKVMHFIRIKDLWNVFVFLFALPFALIAKIFIRNFWLICEEKDEARDNGYWLFKWIRENKPHQKVAYAVNKKSVDYKKVKDLGKIIGYGTFAHWFWYIVADKNISSQKGGKPNAAVCYFLEVVLKLRKNNRVFLQHGVTVNKGDWLLYENTRFRLFTAAAKPEFDYLLKEFGYPLQNIALTGFPRFDELCDFHAEKDLVLVMPSWRNWLARYSNETKHLDFTQTEYFQRWNEFLNCDALNELLQRYHKKLIFYPHRNMQKFLSYFSLPQKSNIILADWQHYDVQDLLKRASLLVTDYSSVFFDFSFMRKPVLFYQFDEAEFRKKQYSNGFFDYKNTILGKWVDNLNEVMINLEEEFENGCPLRAVEEIEKFFPYQNGNCERVYEAIWKTKK